MLDEMYIESEKTSLLGENKYKTPSLFQTFKFYISQPRVYDWILGILCVGAVIATIVICII
jgi:hypothetical protein